MRTLCPQEVTLPWDDQICFYSTIAIPPVLRSAERSGSLCDILTIAELAYKKCRFITSERESNKIPLANWTYLALMHQGKTEKAQEVLASIPDDMTTSDYNIDYLEMINFYKGKLSAEQLLEISEGLTEAKHRERVFSVCTHAFGLANHFYTLGDRERYHQLIDYTLEIGRDIAWNSFGYAGAYYTKTYRQM